MTAKTAAIFSPEKSEGEAGTVTRQNAQGRLAPGVRAARASAGSTPRRPVDAGHDDEENATTKATITWAAP